MWEIHNRETSVRFLWRPVPEHLANLPGIGEPLTVGDPLLSQTGQLPRPLGQTSLRKAQWFDLQWLTKLSQCLVLLDYSLKSFECKTYINKVLVHQRKNLVRAMQPSKHYEIPIRGDEDMGNSNQVPIDSVLWDGIRTIRIWCSIYYITCNPW